MPNKLNSLKTLYPFHSPRPILSLPQKKTSTTKTPTNVPDAGVGQRDSALEPEDGQTHIYTNFTTLYD